MRWVGVLVCFVAAYRLEGTPLQVVAGIVAAVSVACALAAFIAPAASRTRVVVGVQHISAALGGFFLFVSIAMG